jgi:hypothetical protein
MTNKFKGYLPVIIRKTKPTPTERKHIEKNEYLRLAITESMLGFALIQELAQSCLTSRTNAERDMELVESLALEYLQKAEKVLSCN